MKNFYACLTIIVFAVSAAAQKPAAAVINPAQPSSSAVGMDGKRIDLADFRGKVVVKVQGVSGVGLVKTELTKQFPLKATASR